MTHRTALTVHLEHFEGPLDLLLYLIQSQELSISKISISQITDQYLFTMRWVHELDFDLASEFLVMAATLVHWKSKALLPSLPGEESAEETADSVPTPDELVRRLQEHQRFQEAAEKLGALPFLNQDVFSRANAKPPIDKIWKSMNLTDLVLSYQNAWVRSRHRVKILKKETVSIADKITEFQKRLSVGRAVPLSAFFGEDGMPTRGNIVVTFLSALELARLKKMKVLQEGCYTPIYIELIEGLENMDSQAIAGALAL